MIAIRENLTIENGEYRRDDIYGYFILKKQE